MLCGETVAVCCENRTEHTDTVRTSQETHHVSATEPNWLMLCGETVAVCCENRTEHTNTVRTSQETHHVSTTEPSRLMLCGVSPMSAADCISLLVRNILVIQFPENERWTVM
jgi:hypothetical protein